MPAGESKEEKPQVRWTANLAAGAAIVLLIIGLRFLATPEAATRTFGLGGRPLAGALDAVIGLRDIWLGGLGLCFALLREWRALALWLMMGALVCLGDAAVVIVHGLQQRGFYAAVAFHIGSGIFCGVLGAKCWAIGLRHRGSGSRIQNVGTNAGAKRR